MSKSKSLNDEGTVSLLSPAQWRYILAVIEDGERPADAFRRAYPKTKATPKSIVEMASHEMKRIREKFATDREFFEAVGLGRERVAGAIDGALRATKIVETDGTSKEVADHYPRLRAASMLSGILGVESDVVTIRDERLDPEIRSHYRAAIDEILRSREDGEGASQ